MLSRASFLSGQQGRNLVLLLSRATATSAASNASAVTTESKSGQLSNRPVRQEPGKVRMGFIPDEWFTFFYKKTGVTGPYTFGVTLSTYLVSKEIYVLEHEFYTGISLLIFWVFLVKKLGPGIASYIDKNVDEYEAEWNQSRVDQKRVLEEQIADEKNAQESIAGQNLLVQAKRENVAMQLEANYRERLMMAYNAVKSRLDYQVETENVHRRMVHRNIIDFVVRSVQKAFTPEQDKQNIDRCIADLGALSKTAKQY